MLSAIEKSVKNKYIDKKSRKKSTKKLPQFSKDDARIITSGKVYRQLFESEVQLINALQKVKYISTQGSHNYGFPLDKNENNSLINGLYDFNSVNLINKEVLILPENLLPSKTQSELIVKMIESRKLKFNKEFEELRQSIGIINKDVHKSISTICEECCQEMLSKGNDIELCFKFFDSMKAKYFSWEEFKIASIKNDEHFVIISSLIKNLYESLLNFEDNRVNKVLKEMLKSSTKLERIGHFAPSSVHRLMNNVLLDTNDSILRNKEMYSDLRTKLMLSTIEDYRKRQLFLKNQILLWRDTISTFYFNEFKNEIENEETKSLNTIKDLDSIIFRLSSDLKDVLEDIVYSFNPEQYDSNYLNQINTRILYIILQFDNESEMTINIARSKVEEISRKYLISMNDLKILLLKMHVFENEEESNKAVEGFCLPILGSLQKSLEKYVDSIEIITEETADELKSQSRKLYNYLSSLLNLWNEHKVSLNKVEENIYQKMNMNRDSHRQQNLVSENELNLFIDKMRQESNEHALKESLSKCFNQLDKIKASYSQFYNQQVNMTKRYHALAEAEVKTFEEKLSSFFTKSQEKTEILEADNEDKMEEVNKKLFTSHFMPMKISNKKLLMLEEKLSDCYGKFIKEWFKVVSTNCTKIVSTKTDELDSELKLRFHLHEPRYHRIEYDIHNVRAAELVIHVERVNRQCKTIDNSLENIKLEYLKLDEIQRLKQEEFKSQLNSDEIIYSNITNHSKLISIQSMLEDRNNMYMNNLRTSLRIFRQCIESNLQHLRQSNAEFVRSFKLFSAGGNFCPGEIEDFNKKIEKVNVKVEEMESEIMSNLEMVEKNHQDNLTLLKTGFEDKFKYHIIDINFLETINRSMSNVQLKIKTEVSNSNSQSQFISEKIKLLESYLKKLLSSPYDPNNYIDKSILKNILEVFGCINDRSIYLDCIKTQGFPNERLNPLEDKDGNNMKVQFISLTAISKGGRQPNEDAGIKSVKTLLKSQKEFLIKNNIESANDYEYETQRNELDNGNHISLGNQNYQVLDITGKVEQTRSASINSEVTTFRKNISEKSKLVNKNQRLEKKYQAFGEEDLEESSTFMKKIKCFCRDILDGILYSAELYYRNKGVRKVTQPILSDNFDQAAEDIIAKLKYYFKQAKDYHDECLQEFNQQLKEIEDVLCIFPATVYRNVLENIIFQCSNDIELVNKKQGETFQILSNKKKKNYKDLKPDLSQTSEKSRLDDIVSVQESLYHEELNQIDKQFQTNRTIVFSKGKLFTDVISNVTEQLLLLMDNLLTVDDVFNSEPDPKFVDTKELVRKQAYASEIIVTDNEHSLSTKNTWQFDDLNDILKADPIFKSDDSNSYNNGLITAKYTSCHVRCIKDREIYIKKFKNFYFGHLTEIEKTKLTNVEGTNNYKQFWDESIQKLLEMNQI